MDLSALLPVIDQTVGLDRLRSRMSAQSRSCSASATARRRRCSRRSRATRSRPILVIAPRPQHAEALVDELAAWLGADAGRRVLLFPERDALPYERLSPDPRRCAAAAARRARGARVGARRVAADHRRVRGGDRAADDCAGQRRERARSPSCAASARSRTHLLRALDAGGLSHRAGGDGAGRGVAARRHRRRLAAGRGLPLRIELFGDDVESIRSFDPATQRSAGQREAVRVGPARELVRDAAAHAATRRIACSRRTSARTHATVSTLEIEALRDGARFDGDEVYAPFLLPATLLDHLPDGALSCSTSRPTSRRCRRSATSRHARRGANSSCAASCRSGMPEPHVPWPELQPRSRRCSAAAALALGDRRRRRRRTPDAAVRLPFGPAAAYGGRLRALADGADADAAARAAGRSIVSTQSQRLAELLEEHDVFARVADTHGRAARSAAARSRSCTDRCRTAGPSARTGGGPDAAHRRRSLRLQQAASRAAAAGARRASAFLADLMPGEYVVHIEHGIARFAGLVRQRRRRRRARVPRAAVRRRRPPVRADRAGRPRQPLRRAERAPRRR